MDAELEFAIQPSTTGKQLFDQVRVCPPTKHPQYVEATHACPVVGLGLFADWLISAGWDPLQSSCVFAGCKDHWSAGGLVLWTPIPGHKGFLHMAETQQEGAFTHGVGQYG